MFKFVFAPLFPRVFVSLRLVNNTWVASTFHRVGFVERYSMQSAIDYWLLIISIGKLIRCLRGSSPCHERAQSEEPPQGVWRDFRKTAVTFSYLFDYENLLKRNVLTAVPMSLHLCLAQLRCRSVLDFENFSCSHALQPVAMPICQAQHSFTFRFYRRTRCDRAGFVLRLCVALHHLWWLYLQDPPSAKCVGKCVVDSL